MFKMEVQYVSKQESSTNQGCLHPSDDCDVRTDPDAPGFRSRSRQHYAPADSRALPSGGIAEALGSRKLDREPPGTEGCRRKPDGKAAVSSFGTRGEADRTLSQAPDPPKNNLCAGIPQGVYNLGLLGVKKDILAETRNNCRKETSATCPEHTKSPSW